MTDASSRTKVAKSDADWRSELSPQEYDVTRRHGTERPFSHPYNAEKRAGVYRCVCCKAPLFNSEAKFDSGTGWPSFTDPASPANVLLQEDRSHGMIRTEVVCGRCGSHLGHVFDDGPRPSGQRWCINSLSLDLDRAG